MLISSSRHRSFFFFKQKTAYEMRISDWSSDVCSSDLSMRQLYPRSRSEQVPSSQGVRRKSRALLIAALAPAVHGWQWLRWTESQDPQYLSKKECKASG